MWRLLLLLTAAALSACAAKPTNAPSTAGVRGNIEAAKTNIEQASAAVKAAGGNNAELQSLAERMEHKAMLIDRWMETQP